MHILRTPPYHPPRIHSCECRSSAQSRSLQVILFPCRDLYQAQLKTFWTAMQTFFKPLPADRSSLSEFIKRTTNEPRTYALNTTATHYPFRPVYPLLLLGVCMTDDIPPYCLGNYKPSDSGPASRMLARRDEMS